MYAFNLESLMKPKIEEVRDVIKNIHYIKILKVDVLN